jgi:hypothetical protein|eukprot:254148-Prymnesium_polylepis.2
MQPRSIIFLSECDLRTYLQPRLSNALALAGTALAARTIVAVKLRSAADTPGLLDHIDARRLCKGLYPFNLVKLAILSLMFPLGISAAAKYGLLEASAFTIPLVITLAWGVYEDGVIEGHWDNI